MALARVKAAIKRRLQKLGTRVNPRKRFQRGLNIPTYRDIRANPELRKFLEEGK